MRIGIDVTPVLNHPGTGIARYIQGLVEGLRSLGCGPTYELLYAASGEAAGPKTWGEEPMHLRKLARSKRHMRVRWLLSHFLPLPLDSQLGPIDLFHATDTCGPRLRRTPMVATVHDVTFHTHPRWVSRPNRFYLAHGIRGTLARSARVLTLSEVVKGELVCHFSVSSRKIQVIHPGIEARFTLPVQEHALASVKDEYQLPSHFILFVGSAERRKNLRGLVTAYHSLLQQAALPHFLVIAGGGGDDSPRIARMVWQLGLEPRVLFLGKVADGELPALYHAADLFVFPSFYEGFGFPPLEAMACGTPVVCSRRGALPETVGDAALLVDPGDTRELVAAMRSVLEREELRRALVGRGLRQASRYSWRKAAERTLNVYNEVARTTREPRVSR